MENMKKTPVIVDFDPGLDDAVCLMMMLGSEQHDIIGLCPVSGNKGLHITEPNALKLLELCKRTDIPVLRGAKKGIFKEERTSGDVHGANGFGPHVDLPDPTIQVQKQYAWDFMYEQAVKYNGELEILAVGPLTNLGIAFIKYPDLSKYLKRIVIMGGAFSAGNWTSMAEFNIWADPDAAKIVFNAGVPMAMMGLEICHKAYITKQDMQRLEAIGPMGMAAADFMRGRVENADKYGSKGAVLCDAVSSAYMICPECIYTEYVGVDVETHGILTEGKTVAIRPFTETIPYKPNTHAGVDLDREKFIDVMVETITNLNNQYMAK